MKTNKRYAEAMSRPGAPANGLKADKVGKEGTDLFIQQEPYFAAYAKYFGRFIEEYKKQGISIGMVMPQNEFNSAQPFPSCTWTPQGLAKLLRHLGPEMDRRKVEVFFGTLERGDVKLMGDVMSDPAAGKWIKGVGVQWAGKGAVADVHRQYPALTIYQSEQECGDGKNSWAYASYCWELMKHYFRSGANGYMYWNLSLQEVARADGGGSRTRWSR
jgi:glucosylceramidase